MLTIFSLSETLGPLIEALKRMIYDVARFIFVLMFFLIPYGIVQNNYLYPNMLLKPNR